jgi:hypothetical protein
MVLMEIVELAWFGMERLCDGKDPNLDKSFYKGLRL